jgi:transposase
MQEISKIHVGLDVHKDSISVSAAEPGRQPATVLGKVAHDIAKHTQAPVAHRPAREPAPGL